jgi:hypothetical protein
VNTVSAPPLPIAQLAREHLRRIERVLRLPAPTRDRSLAAYRSMAGWWESQGTALSIISRFAAAQVAFHAINFALQQPRIGADDELIAWRIAVDNSLRACERYIAKYGAAA